MTKYYIEDFIGGLPSGRKPRLIRQREGQLIERYDRTTKKWIPDVEMLQIYTGDIDTNNISEEEVKKLLDAN